MTTIAHGLDGLRALRGHDLGVSRWLEVSQERVNTFADATDDHQWIHVDVERAALGPFGGTIAHGYLTASLIIPLFVDLLEVRDVTMVVNYGLDRLRFTAPVPVGSRIRLQGKVAEVADAPSGARECVQMTLDSTVEIDGSSKPACVARAIYRYYG